MQPFRSPPESKFIPHPLEWESQHPVTPVVDAPSHAAGYVTPPGQLLHQPIQYTDVYLDDFIALAQHPNLPRTLHHTVSGILSVFRDNPLPHDPVARTHIISTSKMAKGDAAWSTEKVVLGWLLNSATGTLQLQPHKAVRLCQLLQTFQEKTRTSRRKWQSLLGELRYMATALQGARYLFSVLQHVLKDQPTSSRLRLSPLVKQTLSDWVSIATDLTSHPMPIASLVPRAPHYAGAVDASGLGCGGFWVATTYGTLPQPIVFREKFPLHIQQQLVSASNLSGSLTNSDLELSAVALGVAALQDHAPLSHACLYTASDNTPTVAWCHKGSTSSIGANAYLLRWIAQLARASSLSLTPISVPGNTNLIADFCSRSFHLSDQAFLQELNTTFPTQPSWKLVHLKPEHVQSWISALSRKMSVWPCATPAKMDIARPQMSGTNFATPSPWTHPCHHVQTPYPRCSSSPIDTAVERLLPAALRSAVKRWATLFVPWARRSPAWD